ncbi:uncharacterized protein FTOL_13814 [Fusarium torulosum]|uniref:Uncharacterized protein n=1 Tax=Fusarium torulosum TaxID=33205 RepID=A0AAE8MPQ1_9HYPO|nr:uncharacterized protein FTOL_13814 [Fusarium torulosum]
MDIRAADTTGVDLDIYFTICPSAGSEVVIDKAGGHLTATK